MVESMSHCFSKFAFPIALHYSAVESTTEPFPLFRSVLHGRNEAYAQQNLLEAYDIHVNLILEACYVTDDRACRITDLDPDDETQTKTTAYDRETLWARKILDKPNVLRLFELVNTTVVMWAHAKFVGELTFECSHQVSKQAISKSNKKPFHVQIMNSVIFSYWQRRLSTAMYLLSNGNDSYCLEIRQLLGRIVLRSNPNVPISPTEATLCCSILGPSTLAGQELYAQKISLIPKHLISNCWSYFELKNQRNWDPRMVFFGYTETTKFSHSRTQYFCTNRTHFRHTVRESCR